MAKRDSRRIFSTVENLSRFSKPLLVRLALAFPQDFAPLFSQGAIPPESEAERLDLSLLVPLLTSRGISPELGEVLFLLNLYSNAKNRRLLAEEVHYTRPRKGLDIPAGLSDADYALTVWLARPSILEAALSRVTLKSRRTFHYFLPSDASAAAEAPVANEESLARLLQQIKRGLAKGGLTRGVAIIPFLEDPNEDWFLIRRSRLPERVTYFDADEREETRTLMLRVYDVVVFDRTTGVLKVNARDGLVELYRQAFSDFYFNDIHFFLKREIFTLDPLRSPDIAVVSCEDVEGLSAVDLYAVSYSVLENGAPTEYRAARKQWYATTMGAKAPVPPEADSIAYAIFDVHLPHMRAPLRCRVNRGNTLSYSRDDKAKAFETFLHLRHFARGLDVLARACAA
ncbi:MAG TPA: hypothetical protein PKE12_09875 [Kiritimatiellia bacterium]|nr:hypothetical protein [Kiritimatiellia bacterium]